MSGAREQLDVRIFEFKSAISTVQIAVDTQSTLAPNVSTVRDLRGTTDTTKPWAHCERCSIVRQQYCTVLVASQFRGPKDGGQHSVQLKKHGPPPDLTRNLHSVTRPHVPQLFDCLYKVMGILRNQKRLHRFSTTMHECSGADALLFTS